MIANQSLQNQFPLAPPNGGKSPSDNLSIDSKNESFANPRIDESQNHENPSTFEDALREGAQFTDSERNQPTNSPTETEGPRSETTEVSNALVEPLSQEANLTEQVASPNSTGNETETPEFPESVEDPEREEGSELAVVQLDHPNQDVAARATENGDVDSSMVEEASRLADANEFSRRQASAQSETESARKPHERGSTDLEPSRMSSADTEMSGNPSPISDRFFNRNGLQAFATDTNGLESVPSSNTELPTHRQTYTVEPSAQVISQSFAGASAKTAPEITLSATIEPGPILGNARAVSTQVAETLVQEVSNGNTEGSKRMTLHLHPAELGKLTVHVGWDRETVTASIVTSEVGTSELLNRDRSWLINNFEDSGFDLSSFDVSYGGSDVEREFDEQFDQASQSGIPSSGDRADKNQKHESQTTIIDARQGKGTVVNIVV